MIIFSIDASSEPPELSLLFCSDNGDRLLTRTLDPAYQKSDSLLPAIESFFRENNLSVFDITSFCVAAGPGSFTSLRLAFSVLKAFSLVTGAPLYSAPTLDLYLMDDSINDLTEGETALALMDARHGTFFSKLVEKSINKKDKIILDTKARSIDEILSALPPNKKIYLTGPGAALFFSLVPDDFQKKSSLSFSPHSLSTAKKLSAYGKAAFFNNDPGLKDYSGPLYFQASSAEINHSQK